MIFQKRHNSSDRKQISGCWERGKEGGLAVKSHGGTGMMDPFYILIEEIIT